MVQEAALDCGFFPGRKSVLCDRTVLSSSCPDKWARLGDRFYKKSQALQFEGSFQHLCHGGLSVLQVSGFFLIGISADNDRIVSTALLKSTPGSVTGTTASSILSKISC